MKKIVNGKRYDTEKAQWIGGWDNGCYTSDFKFCEEVLYKTPKGAYFLAGSGGPLSKYSKPCGTNSVCGGSDIIPLTKDEAAVWAMWAETHLSAEEYEAEFGVEDA